MRPGAQEAAMWVIGGLALAPLSWRLADLFTARSDDADGGGMLMAAPPFAAAMLLLSATAARRRAKAANAAGAP